MTLFSNVILAFGGAEVDHQSTELDVQPPGKDIGTRQDLEGEPVPKKNNIHVYMYNVCVWYGTVRYGMVRYGMVCLW